MLRWKSPMDANARESDVEFQLRDDSAHSIRAHWRPFAAALNSSSDCITPAGMPAHPGSGWRRLAKGGRPFRGRAFENALSVLEDFHLGNVVHAQFDFGARVEAFGLGAGDRPDDLGVEAAFVSGLCGGLDLDIVDVAIGEGHPDGLALKPGQ